MRRRMLGTWALLCTVLPLFVSGALLSLSVCCAVLLRWCTGRDAKVEPSEKSLLAAAGQVCEIILVGIGDPGPGLSFLVSD